MFGPGQLQFLKRGTVHTLPDIVEDPLMILPIYTPRCDPEDTILVNPADGTPETFVRQCGSLEGRKGDFE